MIKEIQSIHTSEPHLLNIYGFGSFFRQKNANDCDLLLVISDDCPNLGTLHADLYKKFSILGDELFIVFDLTILTEREHKSGPLREHDQLIEISLS